MCCFDRPQSDVSKLVDVVATDPSHGLLQVDSSGNGGANGLVWHSVAVRNGVDASGIVNLVFEQAAYEVAVHA